MVSDAAGMIDILNFSSTDINKFLWMVRIGGSTDRGKHIKEWDYYTPQGEFRVDREGSPTLLNCLMYKLCYYRFGQVYTEGGAFECSKRALSLLERCLVCRPSTRLRPRAQRGDRQ